MNLVIRYFGQVHFVDQYMFLVNIRGIGAVVYHVPELENDEMLKISLRSIESEDTTPISQVILLFVFYHQQSFLTLNY